MEARTNIFVNHNKFSMVKYKIEIYIQTGATGGGGVPQD